MSKEGRFTVFCMESYKRRHDLSGADVLDIFERYDVFGYIREFFDILHTTGQNYINDDIDFYLKSRGAQI